MIETTHILAGAVIGAKTTSLPLAALFGFVSHLILDLIPHRDPEMKFRLRDFVLELIDPITGILTLGAVFYFKPILFENLFPLVTAVFFAVLPDFFSLIHYIFPKNKFLRIIWRGHQKIHWWEDQAQTIENPKPSPFKLWVFFIQPLLVWPILIYLLIK